MLPAGKNSDRLELAISKIGGEYPHQQVRERDWVLLPPVLIFAQQ